MKAVVTIILAMSLSAVSEARKPRPPSYDCSLEISDAGASWKIENPQDSDWLRGHWAWRNGQGTHFMGFVSVYEIATTNAFRAQGFFSSQIKTSVYVSPMRPVPEAGAWLTLRAGAAKIGPFFFGERKRGRSAVVVEGKDLATLFEDGPEIALLVQNVEGKVLFREAIKVDDLKTKAARLQSLHREMETNRLTPAEHCMDLRDQIILMR
jgi:hypothetical protein